MLRSQASQFRIPKSLDSSSDVTHPNAARRLSIMSLQRERNSVGLVKLTWVNGKILVSQPLPCSLA